MINLTCHLWKTKIMKGQDCLIRLSVKKIDLATVVRQKALCSPLRTARKRSRSGASNLDKDWGVVADGLWIGVRDQLMLGGVTHGNPMVTK